MPTDNDKIREILDAIEDAENWLEKEKLYTRICLRYAHAELLTIYEKLEKQESDYIECMTDEMHEEFEEITAEELAEFERICADVESEDKNADS